jgi:SAM-dependent methyltransferase
VINAYVHAIVSSVFEFRSIVYYFCLVASAQRVFTLAKYLFRPLSSASQRFLLSAIVASILCAACTDSDTAPSAKRAPTIAEIQATIAAADASKDAYYAKNYAPVEARYWTHIAGWMVVDWVERAVSAQRPVTAIVDIGCGYGTLLAYAAQMYGASGTCVDVVQYLQPPVMQRYGLSFVAANIEKDTLPSRSGYDVAIMTEVLEHLNFQPVPTLKKIHASLRPGGAFFLSTPDADGGWGRTTKYYPSLAAIPELDSKRKWIDDHVWQYNQTELEEVLHAAGFKIHKIERSDGPQGKHFNVWAVRADG